VLARNWFGIEVSEGEDRFITHHVLLRGYRTFINTKARCWTKAPEKYPQFFKQQYRWRKSGVRDFFLTYKLLWRHFGKVHPNGIYCSTIVPLTLLACTAGLFVAPCFNPLFFLHPLALAITVASGAVIHMVVSRHHPEQKVRNPLAFGLFSFWWIVNTFYLTVLCLLTLDFSDWGSRARTQPQPQPAPVVAKTPLVLGRAAIASGD
jgi:cellulose synthase/poly-beta-1,6-N-acetylglucosamine synthase-like glycosyltransferase